MIKYYELIVFTASKKVYADTIIDYLDPENKFFTKRLYRESCLFVSGVYIKDLKIFKNRDLKDIIIVDKSCLSYIN